MKRNLLLIALCMAIIPATKAQDPLWVEQMQDYTVNFYTVQQNFEEYWKDKTIEKGKGWKQFKRWEAFMEPRVYPEGQRPAPFILAQEYELMKMKMGSVNSGSWQPLGPYDGNALNGIGRFNRLAFDPLNDQIIWAGSPAGGLWKSTDGGQNWSTNTDLLPNLGVSDIVINPLNPQIMYIATGDQDGGDTYSYGVLKSTDGGQTWQPTGLSFGISQSVRIQTLYINPQNPQVLIATSRQGLYRTTNGGANWNRVTAGNFNSLVQKPGDPNTLYMTSTNRIWKSTNNGVSWTQLQTNTGLPNTGISRIELAVTPDDPNMVYALFGASNNGFLGVYRSTDNGNSWTARATSPNLLGWSVNGNDSGGQAWYDLAIAVDPADKNRVFVGGVNIWTSSDGGANWNLEAHWYGGGGAPFVHADIHDLIFRPQSGDLFAACDGGVYRKNNAGGWDELNNGLNITQYYRLGASATDTSLVICGSQDNGTHLYDMTWDRVRGGDGMECAIDPQNPNVMYSSVYYGDFRKSVNGGASFNATFNLPPAGTGNWVTPFMIDPLHPDTLYAGFSKLYRSYDGGVSFSAISPSGLIGNANIEQMAISHSDPSHIYLSKGNGLWFSTDRGNTVTNQSSNLSGGVKISYITVDPDDPLHVVISRSGYASNQKVYESFDGGFTWLNITDNLPNVPANCVVMENNKANSIYVGTDLGVFYRDDNMNEWIPFNANLPNLIVNELEITYEDRKIKAATYARGLWISPLYGDNVAPVSNFHVKESVCWGDTLTLTDLTSYQPDTWVWNITPNTFTYVNGTGSTSQNPQVYFNQKGIYNISLTTTNNNGSNTLNRISAVAVGGFPLPYSENFEDLEALRFWMNDPSDLEWKRVPVGGNTPGQYALKASQFFRAGQHSIISPSLSFENHDSVSLSFEHAYVGRPGFAEDTLRIYVAVNCTDNWVLAKEFTEDGSKNFVTNNPVLQDWTPSQPSDWCGNSGFADCPEVDLSTFAGMAGVRLKFEAASASDNNIFIDNIFISGNPTAAPNAAFSSSTQVCALQPLNFSDQSYGSPNIYTWYFPGSLSPVSNAKNPQVIYPAAGTYDVSLVVTNAIGSDSIFKSNYVQVAPADSVSIDISSGTMPVCTNDTLHITSSTVNEGSAGIIQWYLNGTALVNGNSSSLDITGLLNGDQVYATLISSEDCAFPAQAYSDTIVANVYTVTQVQFPQVNDLCVSDNPVSLNASPAGGSYSGNGIIGNTFDPATAGAGQHEVTYTFTDGNGCDYYNSIIIVVDNPANIILTSPGIICSDDGPVLLNSGYPAGGTYSGPGITADYFFPDSVAPGTYTIYYSYAAGNCPATTDSTTIQLASAPPVPVITYNNGVLESSVSASFYQWYRGGASILGATNRTYTPVQNGLYTVEVRDTNMCSTRSSSFNLNNIGLEDLEKNVFIHLYPNPAEDILVIAVNSQQAQKGYIQVYNTLGQKVKVLEFNEDSEFEFKLDISSLPVGMYILNMEGTDFRFRREFVKK